FRDQFHLEQRPGCWVGTTEQALDITETVRISIANCHYIFSLMNKASTDERRAGQYQRAAIESFAPGLASVPFNPISMPRLVRRRIVRVVRMGFESTAVMARAARDSKLPVRPGAIEPR